MIRDFWLSNTEKWLRATQLICGGLVVVLGLLLKFEPATIAGKLRIDENSFLAHLIKDILSTNAECAWIVIPGLTFIAAAATYFKTHFGNRNTWATVTTLLEELRLSIFDGRPGFTQRPQHHERVTLYKFRKWRFAFCLWPWSGWVVPVARTGVATLSRRIPRFKCPMSNPGHAVGVAGQAYANKCKVSVPDLPRITGNETEVDRQKYAQKGLVSQSWVENRKECPIRSLLGIPIEVKGKHWGVIVVDSREPDEIVYETYEGEHQNPEFRMLSKVLAKLLED